MSLSYTATPFQPTNPYPNQVTTELNLANQNFTTLAQAFVNSNPTSLTVLNSASVGGYGVSATPTPNTLLPLNSNAVFYNALSTTTLSNNFNLTLANGTSYNILSVTVSTPAQPLVNNYKVVFKLIALGQAAATGVNNFQLLVATNQESIGLTPWYWNAQAQNAMGFGDVAIFDQPPNTTVSYTIKCGQWGGNANFILTNLTTTYAVFPG